MPLDRAVLGNLAQEHMAALEEAFGDTEEVEMGTVMTFVEIRTPVRDDDGNVVGVKSDLRVRHNEQDPFRAVGLLDQAKFNILAL